MVDEKDIPVLDVDYHLREYDEQDVLQYLEQCYSFNRDSAIEKAINEIKRLRDALRYMVENPEDIESFHRIASVALGEGKRVVTK
jgi:hypothetical protein